MTSPPWRKETPRENVTYFCIKIWFAASRIRHLESFWRKCLCGSSISISSLRWLNFEKLLYIQRNLHPASAVSGPTLTVSSVSFFSCILSLQSATFFSARLPFPACALRIAFFVDVSLAADSPSYAGRGRLVACLCTGIWALRPVLCGRRGDAELRDDATRRSIRRWRRRKPISKSPELWYQEQLRRRGYI